MPTVVIGNNTGDDYSGTEDAQITNNDSTGNYGANTDFAVTNDSMRHNAPLSFSGLSSLPDGITISAVTVDIYRKGGAAVTYNIQLRQLLRNWVEGSVTWVSYDGSSPWTTSGGLSEGNDISASVAASISVNSDNGYKTFSNSNLTSLIQDLCDGMASNYGVNVIAPDSGSWYHVFTSSEGTDGQRPYLSVTYTASGGNSYYYQQQQM